MEIVAGNLVNEIQLLILEEYLWVTINVWHIILLDKFLCFRGHAVIQSNKLNAANFKPSRYLNKGPTFGSIDCDFQINQ